MGVGNWTCRTSGEAANEQLPSPQSGLVPAFPSPDPRMPPQMLCASTETLALLEDVHIRFVSGRQGRAGQTSALGSCKGAAPVDEQAQREGSSLPCVVLALLPAVSRIWECDSRNICVMGQVLRIGATAFHQCC